MLLEIWMQNRVVFDIFTLKLHLITLSLILTLFVWKQK